MKMAAEVRWLFIFNVFCIIHVVFAEIPHRKFEYKYSFKPPYLAQKDGSVNFWEYGGNTIASAENVRVAPSLRSQKGAIWVKNPVSFDWWEVELVFRITGRGRIGADGLAFWYTSSKGAYNGTVFGSSDQWNGLGIFFDSFDNDNQHNNPYIMAVINDGTKSFDHSNDGANQLSAGCLRDFRNKPFATKAKIEYYKNILTVLFHNGMTNNEQDYEICFRVENIVLPKGGYFGVSAATGGLADDHDVSHFLTHSLYPLDQLKTHGQKVSIEEQQKINQEYMGLQQKLEKQKTEYLREHPNERANEEFEYYESDNQRELRHIILGQAQMGEAMRELNNKLDEVIGRQERSLSLISQLRGGGAGVGTGRIDVAQPGGAPLIGRHDIDTLLTNQNIILSTAKEIRSFVTEVSSKTDNIMNNQARAPTAQVQPMGYDYHSLVSEMRDGLNTLKRDIDQMNSKGGGGNCPTTTCLTTTMFLLFVAIQMVILLAYSMYRDNKDAKAKKLY